MIERVGKPRIIGSQAGAGIWYVRMPGGPWRSRATWQQALDSACAWWRDQEPPIVEPAA